MSVTGGAERPRAAAWLLACLLAGTADAGQPAAAAGEITALIARLGQSQCRFQRNGSWYDADRARQHLQRKYDYLQARGMASTAEQFIEQAASRSSVSGKPYRVACPGRPETDAADWFDEQLRQLRHHAN